MQHHPWRHRRSLARLALPDGTGNGTKSLEVLNLLNETAMVAASPLAAWAWGVVLPLPP